MARGRRQTVRIGALAGPEKAGRKSRRMVERSNKMLGGKFATN